jgi:hypothetical protein
MWLYSSGTGINFRYRYQLQTQCKWIYLHVYLFVLFIYVYVFKMQACRGTKISEKMSFKSKIQVDSTQMNAEGVIHRYSIPVEADQIVAFSTYEG